MSLTLVTRPTAYPVTLAEVKSRPRIEHDDDDADLVSFIAAATDYVENYTGRDLMQRTWAYSFDKIPAGDIALPKFPVLSVSSLVYTDVDTSPNLNTLATSFYGLDSGGHTAILYLKYDQSWPSYTAVHNGITVTFISGYEGLGSPQDLRGNIPDTIKTAIMFIAGDLYERREQQLDFQVYDNQTANRLLSIHRLMRL